MKRNLLMALSVCLVCICLLVAICFTFTGHASERTGVIPTKIQVTGYDSGVDYMALMKNCVSEGTKNALSMGAIYEEQRNIKISSEALKYESTRFFDCYDASVINERLKTYNQSGNKQPEKPSTKYYTSEEIAMVAKVLYSECRGVGSITEQAVSLGLSATV